MKKQEFNDLKESVVEIGRVLKGEIPPSRIWKIDDNGKRTLVEDNSKLESTSHNLNQIRESIMLDI